MTINEYQKAALRTEGFDKSKQNFIIFSNDSDAARLLNGLMGLNGEAGECIDLHKKYIFQGHPFNREHMAKELGDVAWYLALSADAIGYDLETIFQMNIDKLKERYPEGFDPELSKYRKENDI